MLIFHFFLPPKIIVLYNNFGFYDVIDVWRHPCLECRNDCSFIYFLYIMCVSFFIILYILLLYYNGYFCLDMLQALCDCWRHLYIEWESCWWLLLFPKREPTLRGCGESGKWIGNWEIDYLKKEILNSRSAARFDWVMKIMAGFFF